MNFLFVKSEKLGSRIIRWGTDEPASHLAVEFEREGVVYHSYGTGIQRVWDYTFKNDYEVVASVTIPTTEIQEKYIENYLKRSSTYQKYDYMALCYFAFRAALHKFLGISMPTQNTLNVPDNDLCTELAYLAAEGLVKAGGPMILPEGRDLAITTPWQFKKLLQLKLNALKQAF